MKIGDVDFVVAWVDGADPKLVKKRLEFAPKATEDLRDNQDDEINATLRWKDHEEIKYMLHSAALFAPWVRRIWIVTDDQKPKLDVPKEILAKIRFVDHTEIFRDYEEYLPTFNSVSIGSMIWRIKGLAEKFVYFNDDCFLSNPTAKSDFFTRDGVVLRGQMTNDINTKLLYGLHQKNALDLVSKKVALRNAHVAIPARKSVFKDFFEKNPDVLRKNIAHRFRHSEQFSAFALSTYLNSMAGAAYRKQYRDFGHISANVAINGSDAEIKRGLFKLQRPHVLLGCINDIGNLEKKGVDVDDYMTNTIFKTGLKDRLVCFLGRLIPKRKLKIE